MQNDVQNREYKKDLQTDVVTFKRKIFRNRKGIKWLSQYMK